MTAILKLVPGWVWVTAVTALLALFCAATLINKLEDQATTIANQNDTINEIRGANASQQMEIARLQKDINDKAATNSNITEGRKQIEESFDDIDTKLAAAIVERDALEVAVAAQQAIKEPPIQVDPIVQKPAAKSPIKNPKDGIEIDIAWEAFCIDNTASQCTAGVVK